MDVIGGNVCGGREAPKKTEKKEAAREIGVGAILGLKDAPPTATTATEAACARGGHSATSAVPSSGVRRSPLRRHIPQPRSWRRRLPSHRRRGPRLRRGGCQSRPAPSPSPPQTPRKKSKESEIERAAPKHKSQKLVTPKNEETTQTPNFG